jgi:uncharacterized protein DUF2183
MVTQECDKIHSGHGPAVGLVRFLVFRKRLSQSWHFASFGSISVSLFMWPILYNLAVSADRVASEIASDEIVVFYPTYAHRTTDEKSWILHIHGRIFEPEQNSLKRAALLGLMRRSFGLSATDEQTAVFQERLRAFLVDNERNKTIYIRLGDSLYRAGKSGPNGHFSADLVLSNEEVKKLRSGNAAHDPWLTFGALLPADDRREFAGMVRLTESRGLSLISDIDDTIKHSEVTDHRALVANTFLRPFKPIPGMSEVYGRWQKHGAEFHYLSASPWQLYEPISDFLTAESFPSGSLHMKVFRLKDRTALALLAKQQRYKSEIIQKILTDFPQRKFILVGDSGEQDPEIYGELARRHPGRIAKIFIRETSGRPSDNRYRTAFEDLSEDQWQVFQDAAELPIVLPGP